MRHRRGAPDSTNAQLLYTLQYNNKIANNTGVGMQTADFDVLSAVSKPTSWFLIHIIVQKEINLQ